MQTYIIFIKVCLVINIINLIILNFYLLKFYVSIFLNVNFILIFTYFITGFFITNILKVYRYSGSSHLESKPHFLYTINFKWKNQLKAWYKNITHYRKTDAVQIPFISHFLLYYTKFHIFQVYDLLKIVVCFILFSSSSSDFIKLFIYRWSIPSEIWIKNFQKNTRLSE